MYLYIWCCSRRFPPNSRVTKMHLFPKSLIDSRSHLMLHVWCSWSGQRRWWVDSVLALILWALEWRHWGDCLGRCCIVGDPLLPCSLLSLSPFLFLSPSLFEKALTSVRGCCDFPNVTPSIGLRCFVCSRARRSCSSVTSVRAFAVVSCAPLTSARNKTRGRLLLRRQHHRSPFPPLSPWRRAPGAGWLQTVVNQHGAKGGRRVWEECWGLSVFIHDEKKTVSSSPHLLLPLSLWGGVNKVCWHFVQCTVAETLENSAEDVCDRDDRAVWFIFTAVIYPPQLITVYSKGVLWKRVAFSPPVKYKNYYQNNFIGWVLEIGMKLLDWSFDRWQCWVAHCPKLCSFYSLLLLIQLNDSDKAEKWKSELYLTYHPNIIQLLRIWPDPVLSFKEDEQTVKYGGIYIFIYHLLHFLDGRKILYNCKKSAELVCTWTTAPSFPTLTAHAPRRLEEKKGSQEY